MKVDSESVLEFNRLIKHELIESILKYQDQYPEERDPGIVIDFIESTDNLFGRDSMKGHITCSAWVLNADLTEVVLVKHRRLDRWIRPGGHIEAMESPFEGAYREGVEETGIQELTPWSSDIFHISVHDFPSGKDGPAHYHYDLRYLFIAPPQAELVMTDETDGVRWVNLHQIHEYTEEATMIDMAEKTKVLAKAGRLALTDGGAFQAKD